MKPVVAVTGGLGFIGTEVVRQLSERHYPIRVIDLPRTDLPRTCVEIISADLRDGLLARDALADADIYIVLAARSAGIAFFNEHPAEMLDDNVRIVSAVWRAAMLHRPKLVVYVSSSCVFDQSSDHPLTEESLARAAVPSAGYPFSKLVGEAFCRAFQKQHGLPYVIVRPFNVYGPGELPGKVPGQSHVIPDLTYKILAGESPLSIFGDGLQTRAFTHVRDIATGIIAALETPEAMNQDFNLGSMEEVRIVDLAQKLWKVAGRTDEFRTRSLPSYPVDVRRRAVITKKASRVLGWKAQTSLDNGIREYVSWLARELSSR